MRSFICMTARRLLHCPITARQFGQYNYCPQSQYSRDFAYYKHHFSVNAVIVTKPKKELKKKQVRRSRLHWFPCLKGLFISYSRNELILIGLTWTVNALKHKFIKNISCSVHGQVVIVFGYALLTVSFLHFVVYCIF